MKSLEWTLRWLGGAFVVVLVLLLAFKLVVSFVQIPWSSEINTGLNGRTPAEFARACDDVGGMLEETEAGPDAASSCTAASGESIICGWGTEQCVTLCEGTSTISDFIQDEQVSADRTACDDLKYLAMRPLVPRAVATPEPDAVARGTGR